MNCDEAKRLMQAELAGDASDEQRARLEAHLAECSACMALWEALSATVAAVGAARPEAPQGRDLSGAVMAQIAREANGPVARGWLAERAASRLAQALGGVAATLLCALILRLAMPNAQALAMLMSGGPGGGY